MALRITRREFVNRAAAVGVGVLAAPVLSGCEQTSNGGSVELRAWSQVTPRLDLWRTKALRAAAPEVEDFDLELTTRDVAEEWPDYLNTVTLAASSRTAPHIVVAGHELCAPWSAAGWIVPFDDCRERHDEFDELFPGLWNAVEFDGRVWGVPFEPEARPMFFHKGRLRELGWSQPARWSSRSASSPSSRAICRSSSSPSTSSTACCRPEAPSYRRGPASSRLAMSRA